MPRSCLPLTALLLLLSACGSGSDSGSTGNADSTAGNSAHAISGTISGSKINGLVVANGNDSLAVASPATAFTMDKRLTAGQSYSIVVSSQPEGQTCSVDNGSGTMGTSEVTNVRIACEPNSYTIGGTVSSDGSALGAVLSNGIDQVTLSSSRFTFPTPVKYGDSYGVRVAAQPGGGNCSVENATGTMGAEPVSNIKVTCGFLAFELGGRIAGLTSAGLVLANGAQTVAVQPGSGSYVFDGLVTHGGGYEVSVRAQPPDQMCSVSNAKGTMGTAPVGNADVICVRAGAVSTVASSSWRPERPILDRLMNGDGTWFDIAPEIKGISGVVADAGGTVYATEVVNVRIDRISPSGSVTTLAGGASKGFADGTGAAAQFYSPGDIVLDQAGNLFVTDAWRIRRVTPEGVVTTLAGGDSRGYADGPGSTARFGYLWGIAIDKAGNLYVSDIENSRIRKITPAGMVSTVAGTGESGYQDGPAGIATFERPSGGIAVDDSNQLYVVDATRIRKIDAAGNVTTLVDGLTLQSFRGLVIDREGALYLPDAHFIRKILPDGTLLAVAGGGPFGPSTEVQVGSAAGIYEVRGMGIDAGGSIYFADYSISAVRKMVFE